MSAMFMAMILTGAGGLAEAQPYMTPPVPIVVPPAPAPAPGRRPELLRSQFTDYFIPADYPAGALQPGAYATVGFRLEIGADGRVERCTISMERATPALETATCRVLTERARFRPALDAGHRPVPGTRIGFISWHLPPEPGAAVQFLIPGPPPPPRFIPPQRARANLNSYFSEDDYPALALRGYHEGTVGFSLRISTSGRVSACQVTASSGSGPLDAATCRILRSRARYTPARDWAGNPAEGRDSGRVTWRLGGGPYDRAGLAMAYEPARPLEPYVDDPAAADIPPGAPPPTGDGISFLRVGIGRDGRVIGCDIHESSGSPALDAAACRLYAARARYQPGRDMAGAAVCDVSWTGFDWSDAFAGAPPAQPRPRAPAIRPARPLRGQLSARLCPGWPVVERQPSPVPHVPAPPERVRINMNSYFSVDDYPATALRANAQGTTTVEVRVGADGRPTGCAVTDSSGSQALDEATCPILMRRARYYPAGGLIADPPFTPDSVRITWRLPVE